MERIFKNEELAEVVKLSKKEGYKVYTWESTNKNITQIFIVNQENQICTVSEHYGCVTYSTVHKPCKFAGTGYRLDNEPQTANLNKIKEAFNTLIPSWDKRTNESEQVKK